MCENAPNLRLDGCDVEFAAMMAPRPLLIVSATGDWTRSTPDVEFPAVQRIYSLYDATANAATVQVDAGHNYNRESREAVYAWFGKWLQDGESPPQQFRERPVTVEPPAKMLVFPDRKLPAAAANSHQLMANFIGDARAQIQLLQPVDAASLHAYREAVGVSYQHAVNARQPRPDDLRIEEIDKDDRNGYHLERLVIGRKQVGERMPALLFAPQRASGAVLVVHYPQARSA